MQRRGPAVSRREFVKAAVAAGGTAALSACLARESPDLPTGAEDLSTLPERQHAWNEALPTDDAGNHRAPRHHLLLALDYGDGRPDEADREAVEGALRALDRAYPRSHEGLLFTVGYSPAYFRRFDAALHDAVDLPDPTALAPFEDPALDDHDALLHLASDHGSVVLGAERALVGERDRLNGVEVSPLSALERTERRTGFVGSGLPADNQDVEGVPDSEPVPEEAPLYMGFKSGFKQNQATEDRVTIPEGPFAGGTTQHASLVRLHLEQWYEQDDRFHREAAMFCPAHAEENRVQGVGENLGTSSQLGDCPAHADRDARESGVVGHSQKTARAREDGAPVILRRDFDSTDDDRAAHHFVSLQQGIGDFVATRAAMNGTDLSESSAVGQRTNNGILQYMTVERRANVLVPPRRHRALPTPRPEEP